jgi:hypothetical protein
LQEIVGRFRVQISHGERRHEQVHQRSQNPASQMRAHL